MKRGWFATTVLAVAMLSANGTLGAEAKSDSQPAGASLNGIWSVISMQDNGRKLPSIKAKTLRFEFTDKKLTMRILDQVIAETEYTADSAKQPPPIDFTFEGKPTPGIFQLQGDDLTICLGRSADKRPTEFISKAGSPSRLLIVLKRGDLGPTASPLFVMGADGKGLRPLAPLPKDMMTGSPDWSPDGSRVAFDAWRLARNERSNVARVYVVGADGDGLTDLGVGAMPSWSPDSKKLVFCRYGQQSSLWIMNADGSDQKPIDIDNAWGCDWSPVGNDIAFRTSGPTNVSILNLDTGKRRSLLETERYRGIYWNPSWSLDGKFICFKGTRSDGSEEVAIVSAQGESHGFRVLLSTKDGYKPILPIVAWDGNAKNVLVATKGPGDKYRQLYLLDPKGEASPKRLPGQDANLHYSEMAWSFDGKHAVFRAEEP